MSLRASSTSSSVSCCSFRGRSGGVAVRACRIRPAAQRSHQAHETSGSDEGTWATTAAGRTLAAAMVALTALSASPALAADTPTIYFGNGCFWGRQKDYVETEKQLKKPVSAVVGYAGGTRAGPDGRVCYYYSDPRTVYERLGHAEVVKVDIPTDDPAQVNEQFRRFADTYFSQFVRTPLGMRRLDPQDAGPGYRNVVGLPGGTSSPLFKVLQEANKNKMELRAGQGNEYRGLLQQPSEDDLMNVVWVVDSNQLPFYQAETYHQFHNGIGAAFPAEYTRDLKQQMMDQGKVGRTGCPELPF